LGRNVLDGDFYGGIYATRLAAHLGVPIRNIGYVLPASFEDYETMLCHKFISREAPEYQYRLIFDKHRVTPITFHAPSWFNFEEKQRYYLYPEEAQAHRAA
jgi:hypothetical protein